MVILHKHSLNMYNLNILIILFFLFKLASYTSCDLLKEEDEQRTQYLEFVDDSGITHMMDTRSRMQLKRISLIDLEYVKFLLYTRRNFLLPQPLTTGNQDVLKMSNFNPNVSTVIIIHGWWGTAEEGPNPVIKEAYLNQMDANVIVLDWSQLADDPDYAASVTKVPDVGRTLARFLEFLNEVTGASFNDMHLIGHSLGAHVAGNAGRSLRGGKVARITALDPAGPLWSLNPHHLQNTDANYVEAIHTNGGSIGLGTLKPWGGANFYPNGGIKQPGCFLPSCSHSRSYQLFASTVRYNNLIARKCSGIHSMIFDNCDGEVTPMGNSDLTKSGYGIYRVDTGSSYPYSVS